MAVATFSLAIDRPVRAGKERETDFPRITVFGKQAENCEKYLAKGRMAAVQGRLQTGSYTNKEGQKVYTTEVIIDTQEFADSKGASDGSSSYQASTRPSPASASTDGFMNIPDGVDDEGLPFN